MVSVTAIFDSEASPVDTGHRASVVECSACGFLPTRDNGRLGGAGMGYEMRS